MLGVVVWEAFFYRKNATWLLFEDLQALVSVQRLWGDLGFSHVVWLVWAGRDGHRGWGQWALPLPSLERESRVSGVSHPC